jgi:hypothetical protein
LFLEIVASHDYKRILKSGEASDDQCQEMWETIVQQHNYHNGNQEFFNYISHLRAYKDLLERYNTVKSSLMVLLFTIDTPTIEFLNKSGYRIETKTQELFEESLRKAFIKSDNINSKLKQKFNQIQNFNEGLVSKKENEVGKSTGFEEKLAELSFEVGFSVDETITLARYNEYVKIINKRNGTGKKRHNNR